MVLAASSVRLEHSWIDLAWLLTLKLFRFRLQPPLFFLLFDLQLVFFDLRLLEAHLEGQVLDRIAPGRKQVPIRADAALERIERIHIGSWQPEDDLVLLVATFVGLELLLIKLDRLFDQFLSFLIISLFNIN